jgi:hypothetical protein
MWTRRQMLVRGGLALLGGAGACFAFPGDNPPPAGDERDALPDGSASRGMINLRADESIDRGLQYLYNSGDNGAYGTRLLKRGNIAVSALAGLAFMAGGHQPGRGAYGKAVTAAVKYVLEGPKKSSRKGYLYNPEALQQGPMYGHGFGTLFLAEVAGMVNEKELRSRVHDTLRDAVALILHAQHASGGWRYDPEPNDADLSVTVCQMMALRAARNAGVGVPKDNARKCIEYVKRCQDAAGFFRYQPGMFALGNTESFARTAAGVSALNSAGVYRNDPKDGAAVEKGLKFLQNNRPGALGPGRGRQDRMHYFYGHYYAVQAMWTAGGDDWTNWYPAIRDELVGSQQNDGSWDDGICPHYSTAMASIILQVPNNYLPILQK